MTDSSSSLIETVADGLFDVLANLGMSPTQDDCNIIARAVLLAIEASGTHLVMPVEPTDEMKQAAEDTLALGLPTPPCPWDAIQTIYASLLSSRPRVT